LLYKISKCQTDGKNKENICLKKKIVFELKDDQKKVGKLRVIFKLFLFVIKSFSYFNQNGHGKIMPNLLNGQK
jgi:hypothetical protein